MGIYNSVTKATSRSGAATTYDGHSVTASDVLNVGSGGINPSSTISWEVDTPTLIDKPTKATVEEAEKEELEAIEHQNAVEAGLRVMKARGKKALDNARLVAGHRGYLGKVLKAGIQIAGANRGLAGKMQDARAALAGMGHSLDQKTQSVDHAVEKIKAKYGQRKV